VPEPKLAITTAVLAPVSELVLNCQTSWYLHATDEYEIVLRHNAPDDNLGVTGSLQWLYEHTTAPIIAFLHSDCEIMEQGWDERVLSEFEDPKVGVVGFGGALQLGADEIYKVPYELHQLRRISYLSNQTDVETHGTRFTGECDVATLDGFALIVRRELLNCWRHCGTPVPTTFDPKAIAHFRVGWPVQRYFFHNYDNALCLEAAKQGYRVRLVGVRCHHHGGATSTTPACQKYWESLGTSDQEIHTQSHLNLYTDGRGWLPLRARV
jgi:hypothetical protein